MSIIHSINQCARQSHSQKLGMNFKAAKHPCTVWSMNTMVDEFSVVIGNIQVFLVVCVVVETKQYTKSIQIINKATYPRVNETTY